VLSGFAEFERSLILKRTAEGRKRAFANGVKFGRKMKLTPHQIAEVRARKEKGDETQSQIAKSFNVSQQMISRL